MFKTCRETAEFGIEETKQCYVYIYIYIYICNTHIYIYINGKIPKGFHPS